MFERIGYWILDKVPAVQRLQERVGVLEGNLSFLSKQVERKNEQLTTLAGQVRQLKSKESVYILELVERGKEITQLKEQLSYHKRGVKVEGLRH